MDARIAPTPLYQQSSIGGGRQVGVLVTDERPTNDLGRRSAAGGTIRMNQDLSAIYQKAIMDGLRAKGFSPVGGNVEGANLKLEIRGLNIIGTTGFWTMGSDIDSAVKITASNKEAKYENFYRASSSNRTMLVSDAKASNVKLNAVVNDTFEKMFSDQKMLETLTGS